MVVLAAILNLNSIGHERSRRFCLRWILKTHCLYLIPFQISKNCHQVHDCFEFSPRELWRSSINLINPSTSISFNLEIPLHFKWSNFWNNPLNFTKFSGQAPECLQIVLAKLHGNWVRIGWEICEKHSTLAEVGCNYKAGGGNFKF